MEEKYTYDEISEEIYEIIISPSAKPFVLDSLKFVFNNTKYNCDMFGALRIETEEEVVGFVDDEFNIHIYLDNNISLKYKFEVNE